MSLTRTKSKQKVKQTRTPITWKEIKRQKVLLFWAGVMMIYGVIFYYLPLAGWAMAFQNYKPQLGILHSEFVGLQKFRMLFSDVTFLRVIRNTLAMGVINLVATFVTAIVFAILLNEIKSRGGKKTVQTISYLPHFLSWIIVTGILHDMLSGTGIVNEVLVNLHVISQPINFFAHPGYFWPIVAFANVWKETGWNAIIYLAAITGIDTQLYEAATVDGANRWQKLVHITVPCIRSIIIVILITRIGSLMQAGFEQIFVLYHPGVYGTADIIDTYVYRMGLQDGKFELATAVGLFKSVINFCLVVAANKIARMSGEEGIY